MSTVVADVATKVTCFVLLREGERERSMDTTATRKPVNQRNKMLLLTFS